MTGRGLRVGSLLGVDIRIDASWLVIFFLVLWSLSAGVFPGSLPERSAAVHTLMGAAGTLLFFASLLAHELSHAWVARRRGIVVTGITLFIFGGVAHTQLDSEDPMDELLIAGVGPLLSLALGALLLGLARLGGAAGWDPAVSVVALQVGWFNLVVAAFNLLPGFPLDGGRILRSALWRATGDPDRATRWAVRGGRAIGYGLMILGGVQAVSGAVVGGLWLVFIGWFLESAASASLREHFVQRYLRTVPVEEVMTPDPTVVHPDATLRELPLGPLAADAQGLLPVTSNGSPEGVITLEDVAVQPQERWREVRARDVMRPLDGEDPAVVVVPAQASLSDVLTELAGRPARPVVVMREGRLVGMLSVSRIGRLLEHARNLDSERLRDRELDPVPPRG